MINVKSYFFLIKARMDIMRLSWTSCRNKKKNHDSQLQFLKSHMMYLEYAMNTVICMYTFGSTRNAVKPWNADARRFHCKNRDTG